VSDQPMREMRSDELVEAIERLSMYPRLIAERAYAEGLAAATPAPLDVDRLERALERVWAASGVDPAWWVSAAAIAAAYAEEAGG